MPAKYPGGYTIIDLGGIDINSSSQTIDNPKIVSIFKAIADREIGKPCYIANFTVDEDLIAFPLLLQDYNYQTGHLYAMISSVEGSQAYIDIDLSDIVLDSPQVAISYVS